ncbi:MAG: helicase-exonuclease AddAB subunit AddB [Clostridia bacterium]|nr:helicase-exonuclease AddAB subunit AddB [Clostridia bacterium]
MGFRVIYGRAGSGKSQYIYNEINEKINSKDNKKIYLITPEQFSATAEQKLMENRKAIINAEIITFNRLAFRVINEIGGVINTNLTKCGKAMLIYSILQQEKKNFTFLNKSDENIEICIRIISELKKHGVTINDLKRTQEKTDNIYLNNKLKDIILIYEKFEDKIKNNYIDETDLLTILAENIDKVDFLKDTEVYIDEFAGFTEQEYQAIKKIIEIANNVTITFCADNLDLNTDPNTDIFYPNKVTYKKIIDLLDKNEKVQKLNLNELYRFKNEELKYIEKYLYNTKIQKCETGKNINLFLAKNYYSEIENVAKNIIKLIKNKDIRYKDISIITKNIENYSSLTKSIFKKYEIPIFIDEKRDLNQNIIVQYVLSIIEVISKNYSYESIFNYLKTGFVEIEENDIFKLEKYCIKYGVKNNKFKNDFKYGINEKNKEEINYLNELRKKIINPLINLKKELDENKTAQNFSKQFYLFLINQNIVQKINKKINNLKKNNFYDLAKEYEESYKIIINILDEINLIFGEEKITLEKFSQIIRTGLKNSELGRIPANQDQVIMGDIDRSRSRKTKVVFIIGLNDGVFPSINKNQGFLDDEDRNYLKDDGIEIAKGTLENLYDDNFNIYKAFTVAEEKLFLSYASSDSEGKSLRASNLVLRIKKIFPKLIEESDIVSKEKNFEIVNEEKLYDELVLKINEIENGKSPEKLFYTVFKYYQENKKYNKLLNENINYINYNFSEKIKRENIDKLYGNNLNTSISKLEKYMSCPFSYFLQYILKLKEKEELRVQSFDTGSFMHEVINSFFEEINNLGSNLKDITEEETEEIVSKIINEKLLQDNNYIFTATEKYKLLVQRLKRIITKSLKYIIQSIVQSEFKLEGTEVEFGEKGKYKPIILDLENGKKVEITGKIDRIDIAKDEKNTYVRIIDYKSSVKNLDFGNVYAGLQLQLITYLDAVCKLEDFVPAGILYFNLLEQLISSNKKLSVEEIEQKIKNNFKMKGLILADVKVAKMQDKNLESGGSEIIPAYIDKTGTLSPKKSSIATHEEFIKLQNYINKTIKEITKEIFNGNIELKPFYKNKKTPCEYCSYKSMCGFNSGVCKKNYRFINKLNKDEILEKINQGG